MRILRFSPCSWLLHSDSNPLTIADDGSPPTYRYALTTSLAYSNANVTTLALIKRVPTLDSTAPMAGQLQMVNLFGDEDTPYESLHAVVSLAVKPWFDAFVGTRPGVRDSDSKIGEETPLTLHTQGIDGAI
jgi:hypothetical protein